ncbi:hypothetical protein [Streptomyces sp. NPDC058695]
MLETGGPVRDLVSFVLPQTGALLEIRDNLIDRIAEAESEG